MAKMVDLTGKRFGRLVVICRGEDYVSPKGRRVVRWKCKCDCGAEKDIAASHLVSGDCVSCGCFHREKTSEMAKRVHTTHNMSRTRLYHEYRLMLGRCYKEKNASYENYGGRGIQVCDGWIGKKGFSSFAKWASENGYDDSLTLDRIDVNADYSPDNCRWVDWGTQYNNTTKSVKLTYHGKTQTAAQWARELGLDRHTIYDRIRVGKPIDEVLGPRKRRKRNKEVV